MNDSIRLVLAGVVRDFVDSGITVSHRYFRADELEIDDPVKFPKGKLVKVTFRFVADDSSDDQDANPF